MLRPPYDRKELERVLNLELRAVRGLLAPVLENPDQCQVNLCEQGFLADDPYRILFASAEGRFHKDCLEQCKGGNPDRISLEDLVELYPNKMLQSMHEYPTARSCYRACIGDAIWKKAKDELDLVLSARWAAFATEANRCSDTRIKGATRKAIIETMLRESLAEAGFLALPVSIASVAKWHPHPSWVDAALVAMRLDDLDIIILTETSRPRKYVIIPDYSSEPDEHDTGFDTIQVSLWAIPRRNIAEFNAIAIKIRRSLLLYYWDFHSVKGLRRIIDAHVAQARITMTKLD